MENTQDWQEHIIFTRPDGSYVITKNGLPYHVPGDKEEFIGLHAQITAFAAEHPEAVQPEPRPQPPTAEELFLRLRAIRDAKLSATDHLIMPDYPLSDEEKAAWTEYRQALRDLPGLEGAPWDGGGEKTPWPARPD